MALSDGGARHRASSPINGDGAACSPAPALFRSLGERWWMLSRVGASETEHPCQGCASQEMWRREHGWGSCTPCGAHLLPTWKTGNLEALLLHPAAGRAPVAGSSLGGGARSPASGCSSLQRKFQGREKPLPQNPRCSFTIGRAEGPAKNRQAHRVLLGGNAEKAEPKPGEGGLSPTWDAAPLGFQSAFSACSEDGEPRGLSATLALQRRVGSPGPISLSLAPNPETYDFMNCP